MFSSTHIARRIVAILALTAAALAVQVSPGLAGQTPPPQIFPQHEQPPVTEPPKEEPPQSQPPAPGVSQPPDVQRAERCVCKDAKVTLRHRRNIHAIDRDHETWWFTMRVSVVCTDGHVADCRAAAGITGASAGAVPPSERKLSVHCEAKDCAAGAEASEDFRVRLTNAQRRKAKHVVWVKIRTECDQTTTEIAYTIVFTKGRFNPGQSDLDGDQNPDGA